MMNVECQTVGRLVAESWNVSMGDKVDEERWVGLAAAAAVFSSTNVTLGSSK